jgi:hypothetical protein
MQVVDLYSKVFRDHELNRKILAFLISYDHEAVRTYAHYPIINGDLTYIYRYTVK